MLFVKQAVENSAAQEREKELALGICVQIGVLGRGLESQTSSNAAMTLLETSDDATIQTYSRSIASASASLTHSHTI